MEDTSVRHLIYRHFAETGAAPSPNRIAEWAGTAARAAATLQRLHAAHALVLDAAGDILMALPFSAVATEHRVVAGEQSWWANCAWDSLAIPAALDTDAVIEANWLDTRQPVDLAIVGGELSHRDGFVHFAIPARRWWDDIVET